MRTEIIRSTRRKKTVQASVVDGVLRIRIPAHFDAKTEAHWVREMTARIERNRRTGSVDLSVRAGQLARRFGLPTPRSIEWSARQRTLWGSCTPAQGTVRISNRVAAFPPWVLDYVIVHELAHLEVSSHSRSFWELVDRYPRAERARGYLIAKADGAGEDIAGGSCSGDDAADLLGDRAAL